MENYSCINLQTFNESRAYLCSKCIKQYNGLLVNKLIHFVEIHFLESNCYAEPGFVRRAVCVGFVVDRVALA